MTSSQKPNTTLNTRPVFSLGGGIRFITNVRGTAARCKALAEAVPGNARRIFVMRSGEDVDVTPLMQLLKAEHKETRVHLRNVGPVLSIHLGFGAFGVAYIA